MFDLLEIMAYSSFPTESFSTGHSPACSELRAIMQLGW